MSQQHPDPTAAEESAEPTSPAGPTEPSSPAERDGTPGPTAPGEPDESGAPDAHEAPDESGAPDGPPAPGTPADPTADQLPLIEIADLGLRASGGWVYQHVNLRAMPGDLVAIDGSSGTGRSALLLTIAGRFKSGTGEIHVAGANLSEGHRKARKQVRRAVTVARLGEHVSVDEKLTVCENLSDAADWASVPRSRAEDFLDAWRARSGLTLQARTPVEELSQREATSLHLILGALGEPDAIVLDDLDHNLTDAEIQSCWQLAADIAATGPAVIATANETYPGANVKVSLCRHTPSGSHVGEPESKNGDKR